MTFDRRASTATQLSLPLDGAPSPLTDAIRGSPAERRAGSPRDRHRARVEGAAAAVGTRPPPDVLVPRELPGRPRPRVHRPLQPPRRRRARPVQRPRDDSAPGLRGGPDRRRQRPEPVRPPADRGQGRARGPCRDGDPGGGAPARLGGPGRRMDGAGRGGPCAPRQRRAHPDRRVRRGRHAPRARPGGGRPGVPRADARAAALRPVRAPPRRPDRPVPRRRADGHPPRQERVVPVAADAEHLQHGPAVRPRVRVADGLRRRRSGTSSTASSGSSPASSAAACRPRAGSRSWATPATPPAASGPSSAGAACRTGPGSS